jgi:cell division septum initiation protein DivIVA
VPTNETSLSNLPEDKQALQAMLRALWQEREQQKQHIEELQKKAQAQARRADELYLENLQLQKERKSCGVTRRRPMDHVPIV